MGSFQHQHSLTQCGDGDSTFENVAYTVAAMTEIDKWVEWEDSQWCSRKVEEPGFILNDVISLSSCALHLKTGLPLQCRILGLISKVQISLFVQ